MAKTSRHRSPRAVTWLCLALAVAPVPSLAGVLDLERQQPTQPAPVEPGLPPPLFCAAAQIDQRGRLVEHCIDDVEQADFAVRVYDSPFDTGKADWLVSHDLFDAFDGEKVAAAVGSGVATISLIVERLLRDFENAAEHPFGDITGLEPTVGGGGLRYALGGLVIFVAVFGSVSGWLLLRRHRRRARRANAARRTATALIGELVTIRDDLRGLMLDSRPGRLDALERVATTRDAYIKHYPYLRLIDRGMSKQIIGFYGELRDLPMPYIEGHMGKLGSHRVLRLEAADSFAAQSAALASRANQLAELLRHWLDENMPRGEKVRLRHVRR